MNNQDQLFRFIFDDLDIRGEVVYLESSWKAVQERFSYPENVQAQLAEALIAAAILAATIKFDGSLILQVQGNGPLTTLVAQASSEGKLRAVAKWDGDVPSGTLSEVFGQGRIVITVNSNTGEPYQSIVALKGDNLGEALEQYFLSSEQLQSSFYFHISEDRIAGLFLQKLPEQKAMKNTVNLDSWERINILAATATTEEILNLEPHLLLHRLFHEEQLSLYEPRAAYFECSCSRQKIESSLLAMGRESLLEILKEEGEIKADCEFCRQHYRFSVSDIDHLFSITTETQDPVRH